VEGFTCQDGTAVPLARSDVNTDDIIPARFLKTVASTGFAPALFANWRYLGDDRTPDPEFVLNQPRYAGAPILVAGENFGCGSSREHAPWALREFGFRCVVAPSFADIFYNNCFNSGILPVMLKPPEVDELIEGLAVERFTTLRIDLPSQAVEAAGLRPLYFDIDRFRKNAMIEGLDDVGWTLSHLADVVTYERRRSDQAPWLFPDGVIA